MPAILFSTFILNKDRSNLSNAIAGGLPADLGFDLSVINNSVTMHGAVFAAFTITGSIAAKRFGAHRWIGLLTFTWGVLIWAHVFLTGASNFYVVRFFLAAAQGGVIPATLVYLGKFYKKNELATRLSWFWGVQSIASAISGLMASGLLQLNGVGGLQGWRWLFLVDGIITDLSAFFLLFWLPKDVFSTKGLLRGPNGWFTPNQEQIAYVRTVRDDPLKKNYEQRVKPSDVWEALTDFRLWGHLLMAFVGLMPLTPFRTYLPLVIRNYGFNVYASTALTAPVNMLTFITMVLLVRNADRVGYRGVHGAFAYAWYLAGWLLLVLLPETTDKTWRYIALMFLGGHPFPHALNVAWSQVNMAPIGKRTVASGMIIAAANLCAIPGAQIYQPWDQPYFRVGNQICVSLSATALALYIVQGTYYTWTNAAREKKWNALTQEQKDEYERTTKDRGNNKLNYRFVT
ncbi:MFS general substrate transporter [Gonapodya prolifera JEL478]|uniref:MFS general substrate transporter n=1 Tax=Gonapodya prolifera (strain JEL478) TaxID=1344416 RepID=A0A138ZWA1_GONPJ|nr:MFS general substrate transporter [Gonapodya prolifera JEL478]KXS18661.1 MFS general substrate transporter [Gonapodya prolifera JEL478]|eukprot:KXS08780.1 MFS general substrate transporter [Gonapodya prolifera JEL478]